MNLFQESFKLYKKIFKNLLKEEILQKSWDNYGAIIICQNLNKFKLI